MLTWCSLKGQIPLIDYSCGQLSMIWAAPWLTSRKRSQKPVHFFFCIYIYIQTESMALHLAVEGFSCLWGKGAWLISHRTCKFEREGSVNYGSDGGCGSNKSLHLTMAITYLKPSSSPLSPLYKICILWIPFVIPHSLILMSLHIRLCNKIFYYTKSDEKECRIFFKTKITAVCVYYTKVVSWWQDSIVNSHQKLQKFSHISECTSKQAKR